MYKVSYRAYLILFRFHGAPLKLKVRYHPGLLHVENDPIGPPFSTDDASFILLGFLLKTNPRSRFRSVSSAAMYLLTSRPTGGRHAPGQPP